jgi:hypothetical protein
MNNNTQIIENIPNAFELISEERIRQMGGCFEDQYYAGIIINEHQLSDKGKQLFSNFQSRIQSDDYEYLFEEHILKALSCTIPNTRT